MIGIRAIGKYIADKKLNSLSELDKFSVDEAFLKDKIGVLNRARKENDQKSSDLCIRAFENLLEQVDVSVSDIECCIVVTQNPDYNVPHTSAIVHGKLGLPESCASFDISLGCSGYVYALSIVKSFMESNGMKKGLLFTSDQYSEILDENDKNTALIFGDAAAVSLLDDEKGNLVPVTFDFGSKGSDYKNLINEGSLYMNGRGVFGFTASVVPKSIDKLLEKASLSKNDIEKWYFHQGSKYIVDTISQRLNLDTSKVVFDMYNYGNTVSSSIPILLASDLKNLSFGSKVVVSGFGVGLSWASAILEQR